MPEISLPKLTKEVKFILWDIQEPMDWFYRQTFLTQSEIETNFRMLGKRQTEYVVQRYLLQKLYPTYTPFIHKTQNGKPYLEDTFGKISISHSKQFLTVSTAFENHGIDLEIVDNRIIRLAGKFCNENEMKVPKDMTAVDWYTLIWSFKESMYKADGLGQLDFRRDMAVHFTQEDLKRQMGRGIVRRGEKSIFYKLYFNKIDHLVITLAYPSYI